MLLYYIIYILYITYIIYYNILYRRRRGIILLTYCVEKADILMVNALAHQGFGKYFRNMKKQRQTAKSETRTTDTTGGKTNNRNSSNDEKQHHQ